MVVGAALAAIACVSAAADVARAQTSPMAAPHPYALKGAPYSAVIEGRHMQSLANGTNIDLVNAVVKQYRDAQGRTRQEHYSVRDGQTAATANLVEIFDAVEGVRYVLDASTHTARSYPVAQAPAQRDVSPVAQNVPVAVNGPTVRTGDVARPDVTHESLGNDSMLGVEVTGSRTTIVYPAGARGNDQPLTVVLESWRSNELTIDMMHKQDDPRTGVVEWRVTQIDRAEPDASLFQVPADYTIVGK
jgi:hypothetical protein